MTRRRFEDDDVDYEPGYRTRTDEDDESEPEDDDESDDESFGGDSDYADRMAERRQMGLSDF